MSKIRPGNKQNSILNGEWAKHVRKDLKTLTSSRRRNESKDIIRNEINLIEKQPKGKKKKNWIIEEYSVCGWKKLTFGSNFVSKSAAINGAKARTKNHYSYNTFFTRYFRSCFLKLRIRNIVTGEIYSV